MILTVFLVAEYSCYSTWTKGTGAVLIFSASTVKGFAGSFAFEKRMCVQDADFITFLEVEC
jgi:hypothetical protein